MVFFHRARQGRVVLSQSTFEYVKEIGSEGSRRIPKWGKTITFEPMADFRFRNKTWRGTQEVDGEEAAGLMTHKQYGIDFIGFAEEGGDADLRDTFFETKPDESVYCWLTDQTFLNAQGAAGHRDTSKKFETAYTDYLNSVHRRNR